MWFLSEINPAVFLGLDACTLNTASGPVMYPVCSITRNTDQRRRLSLQNPLAGIGFVTQWDDGSTQNYHGLLLNTTLRSGRNLNINANYTWSHCIGDAASGNFIPGPGFAYSYLDNRRLHRGSCVVGLSDRRHIFNLTPVVRTPQFASHVLRSLGTGWTLSMIYRYQTGAPLTIVSGLDRALSGVSPGLQNARQLSPNVYASNKAAACANVAPCVSWLNAAAFDQPPLGTLSDLGRDTVAGPAFWQFDVALSRSFPIGERHRLEVRAEAFNVLNGVRLYNPGTNLNNQQFFGVVLGAQDPRIMQFALKYVF